MEEIRKLLLCCSSRGDKISFNEFYHIMTREHRDDYAAATETGKIAVKRLNQDESDGDIS